MHLNDDFFKSILDAEPPEWTPSLNLFAGLFLDELVSLAGYRPGPDRHSLEERTRLAVENLQYHQDHLHALPPDAAPDYPPRFIWMDVGGKDYVSPVKNQRWCSSCAAFGTIAAVECLARIALDCPVDSPDPAVADRLPALSEGQLFFDSPGFSAAMRDDTHNCQSGWDIDDALDFLQSDGVVPETLYPYDPKMAREKLPAGWQKMTTAISGFHTIDTHAGMKSWLATRGPLVSAMMMHADLLFYGQGVYSHVIGPDIGGHCVCVLGYDDRLQAWLCKNSWGTRWGEEGCFWIGYGQCGIDARMWAIEGLSRIYEPPAAGRKVK